MSGASVAPGPKSMRALAWIARVGATPFDALHLMMGCSRRKALDHVRRLEARRPRHARRDAPRRRHARAANPRWRARGRLPDTTRGAGTRAARVDARQRLRVGKRVA